MRAVGLNRRYMRGSWLSQRRHQVQALCSADLEIRAGSTMALIGASGAGKSTLARCLACLEEPDSGEVWFDGHNLVGLRRRDLAPFRRQIQLIFQDPAASLNPRFTAVEIVSEPLFIARLGTKKEQRERALDLMEQVGLSAQIGERWPWQLSGGQRRRLAIARALALQPRLLILDEALAGLDLSTQAQICNLLVDLQNASSLTYLFISHDLGLLAHLADAVAVLEQGRVVERTLEESIADSRASGARQITGRSRPTAQFASRLA